MDLKKKIIIDRFIAIITETANPKNTSIVVVKKWPEIISIDVNSSLIIDDGGGKNQSAISSILTKNSHKRKSEKVRIIEGINFNILLIIYAF